jgi:uncharacterized membrane protein YesL
MAVLNKTINTNSDFVLTCWLTYPWHVSTIVVTLRKIQIYQYILRNYISLNVWYILQVKLTILGAFAKLRKAIASVVMSVCLSVYLSVRPHGTSRLPLNGFFGIWCSNIFRRTFEKIKVSLKSDKNSGYFTWTPIYIYSHISLNSS